MLFSTAGYFRKRRYRQKDIEKAMVFEAIVDSPYITRKKLHTDLKLRPNNVTNVVQELVEEGMVLEHVASSSKKGRPEIPLSANENKLICLAFWVVSHELIGARVNMKGENSHHKSLILEPNACNEDFKNGLMGLIESLRAEIPRDNNLLGIGLSLPGIINRNEKKWYFNSRWPNVKDFSFQSIEDRLQIPVLVEQIIDAELVAMISKTKKRDMKDSLLVHWGYGIGASFSHKGKIINSSTGSFCELGHLKITGDQGGLCTCGEIGCLETVSSIRVLLPRIREEYGPLPDNERQLASSVEFIDFSKDQTVFVAVKNMADAVNTAYRILFPDLIIIYGPLVTNLGIRKLFQELLEEQIPIYARNKLIIEFIESDTSSNSSWGSTIEFFKGSLRELLKAHR